MPRAWPDPADKPISRFVRISALAPILGILSTSLGCSGDLSPLTTLVLPRPSVAAADGGWPATGIARLADGDWVIGHDGRRFDGDKHRTRLVILTPDMRTIRRELDLVRLIPGIESVQGVAVDHRGIWIGDLTGKAVRLIANGKLALSMSFGFKVNGVASDGRNLYIGAYDDDLVRVVQSGRVVRTIKLDRIPDQLHFASGRLYVTDGENGEDGNITAWNVDTGERIAIFDGLRGAQAMEGVHIDGQVATVISDGGFHREAKPPKTLALRYLLDSVL